MPTYVYACTNPDCAHQFDAIQAFTDDALTECPVCGQRLRKVFGSVGVVFKGSGFYRNDSRSSSSSSTPASAGKSETSAPAAAAASSSDGGSSSSSASSDSSSGSSSSTASGDAKPSAKKTGDSKVA